MFGPSPRRTSPEAYRGSRPHWVKLSRSRVVCDVACSEAHTGVASSLTTENVATAGLSSIRLRSVHSSSDPPAKGWGLLLLGRRDDDSSSIAAKLPRAHNKSEQTEFGPPRRSDPSRPLKAALASLVEGEEQRHPMLGRGWSRQEAFPLLASDVKSFLLVLGGSRS